MAYGELRWTEIDVFFRPDNLHPDTQCLAYYDYDKNGPWQDTSGRQTGHGIIKNLKRAPHELLEHPSFRSFKNDAIRIFASLLRDLLADCMIDGLPLVDQYSRIALVPIPPSKTKASSEYDDRIHQVCNLVADPLRIAVIEVAEAKNDMLPSRSGGTRDPNELYSNYRVLLDPKNLLDRDIFFVVDDVLTTGCHFEVIRRILLEHCPTCSVIGLFLARTIQIKS